MATLYSFFSRWLVTGCIVMGLAGMSAAQAGDVPGPAEHASNDIYMRFERIGYYGNIYLNGDGSYLIVQTSPAGITVGFTGHWTAHGARGFCIHPDGGSEGKCLPETPPVFDVATPITSDHNEDYIITLRHAR